jgi:hypothetical protein
MSATARFYSLASAVTCTSTLASGLFLPAGFPAKALRIPLPSMLHSFSFASFFDYPLLLRSVNRETLNYKLLKYEVVSKILRTGAAIDAVVSKIFRTGDAVFSSVVIARSTGRW